jgi:hypothetical protein
MFEVISHCYKNCLDRCDDFSLSFCLKVITVCPPTSFPQLHISVCCRYNLIPPDTPFSPALTQNVVLLQKIPMQSHDCNWRKAEYLNEWSLCSSLKVLKIGGQDRFVCLFVTWDPNILHQAVNNLEAISKSDQLKNACVWHRVRIHRKTWPANNAWESSHVFLSPDSKVLMVIWQGSTNICNDILESKKICDL